MMGSLHQANSYEHLESGHTTEDNEERNKQVEKRNRKTSTYLASDVKLPQIFGNKEAELTLISWGSMKGPILQAMKESGNKFNYLHFSYLWPLPENDLKKILLTLKKTLLIENNSTGQLGMLLKMVTGMEIKDRLLKYDGRPIYPEEILDKIKQFI